MEKPKFDGIEKYIFSDVYLLLVKYIDVDSKEIRWGDCLMDIDNLCIKYENYPLCVELIVSVLSNIEYKINGAVNKSGKTYNDYILLKEKIKNNKIEGGK